ncbi:PCMD domain-containing protein [Dysgonomonas sp. BGC7]|uniref:PCMD domain-containing protein n=1 Tax=Dysgonomonas sp. BGC7 TaxID=1658008 RepID=UPI000681CA25|nr:PCMD domain-containing protein [Dysgonomonas sp. BGC7]MBD8388489.1 PCMD domain-containing protein [Dysgonomonas sp. BGC7]
MRQISFFLVPIIAWAMTSCIKDEPLSREADIIEITVDNEAFIDRSIAENKTIKLLFSDKADLSKIAPIIAVTAGSTVEPASGDTVDFSYGKQVEYKVTSEDKKYTNTYIVSVGEVQMKYNFEDWTTAGTEQNPYPILSDQMWSNANSGVSLAILVGAINPDRYPTEKTEDSAFGKYAASLQTLKGGKVILWTYPIFAGNLFLGDFAANPSNALKSLKLGRNHPKEIGKPITFRGYYKYKPGPEFTGSKGEIINKVDSMSMYAALFKVTKGAVPDKEFLDGETILTSDRVIARAEWHHDSPNVTEKGGPNGFTEFVIPFKYTGVLDYEHYDYRITIVCSSSKDGNLYEGAVGSTLIVDELEIICDPIK